MFAFKASMIYLLTKTCYCRKLHQTSQKYVRKGGFQTFLCQWPNAKYSMWKVEV